MYLSTLEPGLCDYFEGGEPPVLLYATRHEFGLERVDRPMHRHGSICELLLVYKGLGSYIVGSRKYPVREGDLIFYNAGDVHEVTSCGGSEMGTYCLGLAGVRLRGLPPGQLVDATGGFVFSSGGAYGAAHSIMSLIYDRLSCADPKARCSCRLLAASLLLLVSDCMADARLPVSSEAYSLSARIKAYIDKHYMEKLSLSDIAAEMRCSPSYVSHAFKSSTGYSPIQYLIRRRMGEAQTLLISSACTATQIAAMVGYDNADYFCSLFTQTVGLPPIKYRKRYLSGMKGERAQ